MTREYPSLSYMYSQCPVCHFVETRRWIFNPSAPCANCGRQGITEIYPELIPSSLYDAAIHFRDAADQRQQDELVALAARIRGEVGKDYEPSKLLDTFGQVRQVYNAQGTLAWTEQTWQAMVRVTAQTLDLPESDASRTCAILFTTNLISEEQTAMVILACSFLEAALSRFLVHVAERHGTPGDEAEQAVAKLRQIGTKTNQRNTMLWYFHQQTQLTFAEAFDQLGQEDFWRDWDQAREDRNDILHGELPFAPSDTRERTLRLLERAIPVFAELQNRHGVTARTS